jgi:hypothetical protein
MGKRVPHRAYRPIRNDINLLSVLVFIVLLVLIFSAAAKASPILQTLRHEWN